MNKINSYAGQVNTLSQWASILGVNTTTLWMRLNEYGWGVKRALTDPVRSIKC
jgi:hypothetical protein